MSKLHEYLQYLGMSRQNTGVIIDIPGDYGELSMRDSYGNVLMKDASVQITAISYEQKDSAKAPVEMLTLNVTRRMSDGCRLSYQVVQPAEWFIDNMDEALKDALGGKK